MRLHRPPVAKKGQVAVWIVLISVVGLTLGLSIAARSLSNLRQSSELEETNRAFSAAEAGVEKALYQLESSGGVTPVLTPQPLSAGGAEYEYTVDQIGSGSEIVLSPDLEKDKVVQVDASGMNGDVVIYWVNADDTDQSSGTNRASLLITMVSKEAEDNYQVARFAYNPSDTGGVVRDNNFSLSSGGGGGELVGGVTFLEKTAALTLPGSATSEKIIRIRALYNNEANTIGLRALSDTFPFQYYVITSTGKAGESQRVVQVTRSKPALPAIFDFALLNLSGSGLTK